MREENLNREGVGEEVRFIEYKAGLLGDSWEGKVATGASYGFFRLTIDKRPSDD